jgi:predicted phosphodiesterase
MRVAVFGDAHAHAEALDAVLEAAQAHGADELWSLGDMIGSGPDPRYVVTRTRGCCRVALMGNHDYVATGAVEPERLGPAQRSLELAREQLTEDDVEWMRTRRPAARRHGVQCWHGGPHHPVWEFVGPRNAADCLAAQREPLGLVAHTHVAAAFQEGSRRPHKIVPGEPLELTGKWLLNPGAVGAPAPACWLFLDLEARTATWHRAPYDPAPARERARALGIA